MVNHTETRRHGEERMNDIEMSLMLSCTVHKYCRLSACNAQAGALACRNESYLVIPLSPCLRVSV